MGHVSVLNVEDWPSLWTFVTWLVFLILISEAWLGYVHLPSLLCCLGKSVGLENKQETGWPTRTTLYTFKAIVKVSLKAQNESRPPTIGRVFRGLRKSLLEV